jgi:hypothetical protein
VTEDSSAKGAYMHTSERSGLRLCEQVKFFKASRTVTFDGLWLSRHTASSSMAAISSLVACSPLRVALTKPSRRSWTAFVDGLGAAALSVNKCAGDRVVEPCASTLSLSSINDRNWP